MNKRYLILSMAAGLAGGAVSAYFRSIPVHAQSQTPEEIRAQRFTLVNQEGVALGTFSLDNSGRPQIILRDASGHEAWKVVADHVTDRSDQHMNYGRFHSK